MKLCKTYLAGKEYLDGVTRLLQRISREDRFAGLYDAGDLQWWWREDQAPIAERQVFWHDDSGPAAAWLLYDGGKEWECHFFALPSLKGQIEEDLLGDLWAQLPGPAVMTVREDDSTLIRFLESKGWQLSGESTIQTYFADGVSLWSSLPPGFRFETRADSAGRPHPMTNKNRNPPDVEARLAECSLYRADLDYAIVHSSGEVAGYALFWMDPITKIGLIEPMRMEDAFQQQGLGTALVNEGVRRLREEGAQTIKISYKENNEAARRLYHGRGFRDLFRRLAYRRA